MSRAHFTDLELAIRWMRLARRSSARAFTALAGLVGITCGVAVLIFAQALARGVHDELQDKILRGTAHITIQRADGARFEDAEARALKARLSPLSEVLEVSATEYTGALLQSRHATSYCLLRGVDASAPRKRREIQETIIAGALDQLFETGANAPSPDAKQSPSKEGLTDTGRSSSRAQATNKESSGNDKHAIADEPHRARAAIDARAASEAMPILVGAELAARLGLERVGDAGEVFSLEGLDASFDILSADRDGADGSRFAVKGSNASRARLSSASPQSLNLATLMPNVRRVRVVGVVRTGLADYDATWVYAAQDSLGSPMALSVETCDSARAPHIADEIRAQLGREYAVTDWRAANASLFAALSLERRVVTIIVALIMFVAALNITTTLLLAVVERRAEIAVLRVLGARAANIRRIFLFEGLGVSVLGALAGALVGVGACLVANRFRLIRLPSDIYSLAFAPLHWRVADVAFATGLAIVFALLATLYPLRAALRVKPLEILRD